MLYFNLQVLDQFFAFQQQYGEKIPYLPTTAFFYGMKVGEKLQMGDVNLAYNITLKRVGPLQQVDGLVSPQGRRTHCCL